MKKVSSESEKGRNVSEKKAEVLMRKQQCGEKVVVWVKKVVVRVKRQKCEREQNRKCW